MELLCPAGSFESLKAAVQNGADAVYLGMSGFNARRFAGNFDDLGEAVSYAHLRGVRVYVTLNTLLKDREFPAFAALAEQAAREGADAFIVQDLGAASLLRRMFPDIPLHASTQTTVHNAENARILEEMGFSRLILARELSAARVKEIRRHTSLELEVFAHGALCVCWSGQCLMSSMLGGRSANRGECAQPCRLPYSSSDTDAPLFRLSPKDLCLVDHIPLLDRAGIHGIKIEGRMKSPEYVAAVTRVYRKALDGAAVTEADRDLLRLAFNRGGFTSGLYAGEERRLYARHPGNIGLYAGEVSLARADGVTIKAARELRVGDVIAPDRPDARERTVLAARKRGGDTELKLSGSATGGFAARDSVRLLKDAALFSELAASANENTRKTRLSAFATLQDGVPAALEVSTDSDIRVRVFGQTPERARTRALTEGQARAQIGKTGDTPFAFSRIDVCLSPDTAFPLAALNALRRDALRALSDAMLNASRRVKAQAYEPLFAPKRAVLPRLAAQVRTWEQARAAAPYADCLYVPVDADFADRLPSGVSVTGVYPVITADGDLPVLHARAARFETVMAGGLLQTAPPRLGDVSLNVMNSETLAALFHLGYARATLSAELNAAQVNDIAVPEHMETELIVYGRLPLMVTEHCPMDCDKKTCRLSGGAWLKDRKGKTFPLIRAGGCCRAVLLNSLPLYMADRLGTLRADVFRLLFTVETPEECARVASHYRAAMRGGAAEGFWAEYTRGHFSRGV